VDFSRSPLIVVVLGVVACACSFIAVVALSTPRLAGGIVALTGLFAAFMAGRAWEHWRDRVSS
jgi:hypothetical protein